MLPTNNNPPASRVHRSDSESSDDGGKSPLPVRRLSNTSVSTETGGASGGSEPGSGSYPGFDGELQSALTRRQSETEEGESSQKETDPAAAKQLTKKMLKVVEVFKTKMAAEAKAEAEAEESGGPEERGASPAPRSPRMRESHFLDYFLASMGNREPEGPTEPEGPAEPEEPAEPEGPAGPEGPIEPEEPTEPEEPGEKTPLIKF